MGLFSKPASQKEVRNFSRGKTSSAKAAEAHAQRARDKAASAKAMRENRAARKK